MAKTKQRSRVFLNIPYDREFEDLYLAYVVGLTQLGLDVQVTLGVPSQNRLATIIQLIESCDVSVHDLSRIEYSNKIPRFNMPLELGLALYCAHVDKNHRVYVFERKIYRAQQSTSDINGLDPQIHGGKVNGVMLGLRNIFDPKSRITVPEMVSSYRAVQAKVPLLKKNAGSSTLFETSAFNDLKLATLAHFQTLHKKIKSSKR